MVAQEEKTGNQPSHGDTLTRKHKSLNKHLFMQMFPPNVNFMVELEESQGMSIVHTVHPLRTINV